MADWKPIATAPTNEAVLIRNEYHWTLGRLVYREVQTLQFRWPPVKYGTELVWLYAPSWLKTIDFVPTEWCRVDHTSGARSK